MRLCVWGGGGGRGWQEVLVLTEGQGGNGQGCTERQFRELQNSGPKCRCCTPSFQRKSKLGRI